MVTRSEDKAVTTFLWVICVMSMLCLGMVYTHKVREHHKQQNEIHAALVNVEPKVVEKQVLQYYNPFRQQETLSPEDELRFCQTVAGESAYESWEGIAAVAETIKNHLDSGKTIDETLALYSGHMEEVPEYVRTLCLDVLYEGLEVFGGESMYFYSPEWMEGGVSAWHETREFLGQIGGHKFFK